jgi:hypothetical protein
LVQFGDVFAVDKDNPGSVDPSVASHSINTEDARPINQGPRRVSPAQRVIIKDTIDALLKAGIIRPSRSPWSSPVVLVPKPGQNNWRMCVDYKKLNAVTVREIYALPRVDDVLDSFGGKMWFSVLDLASGYFQIPMDESSKEKTAFTTYEGHFEYNFMSFGLVNAPATFSAFYVCNAGLKWNLVQVMTYQQHIKDLIAVLSRFKEAGLHLKSSKCHFCCPEVKYLGHLISKDGVKTNPEKTELIRNWGVPSTSANLHSFLGLAGYYI